MKFTKEEAVKELEAKYKPRYGEPAKWQRTISESVEHAMKLIGEESEIGLDAFVSQVVPFLETTAGFVLKETSEVATPLSQQIEDLKKQIGALEQKSSEPKKAEAESDLAKRIAALEEANAELTRREAVKAKRTELAGKLKEKGVKDSKWVELMLEKAQLTPETDTDKESDEYLGIYNRMFAGSNDDSTPMSPKGEPTDRSKAVIEEAAKIAKNRIA